MRFKRIINMFKRGNVCVFGLRGSGKDVLFGNVIARRRKPYISNLDYTNDDNYNVLDMSKLDCGGNTYKNFISGDIKPYSFPYPMGTDVYISDAGIYFPSQYCGELNSRYKSFPTYFALSRQCSRNNVHTNSQGLGRCWDKIREQAGVFILCRYCFHIGKIFLIGVTIYDKYESALEKARPWSLKLKGKKTPESKAMLKLQRENYRMQHGSICNGLLIFVNRSKHDTYYFEKYLKGDPPNEEKA